ncbi:pyridoxamine 5'-phosphate oxidase family protein [Thalassobacillus pellis]|uniref:pyridoxamine 5'-phosphate oxidase family protein n=1 Tax=Thalassobacillus pellis TaxID=748008 RepID=UPI001960838F|nr:pyridoxamine 5'-phosphate oxidase family protein [Thalassobacillus pellis]MBM7554359.1 PPOX class probable FMN-dependent enzyme [Thalassobacillus pellis]
MPKIKQTITTPEELYALQGEPGRLAIHKVIDHIDTSAQHFISLSPFLVLATSDSNGNGDSSPRGDAPGFVYIWTKKHLLIPELPGNKRMDSLLNILNNPAVGLLFMIPGLEETLRVNGTAVLTKDPDLLDKVKSKGKTPKLAIAVEVRECYVHCAKALKRSQLWDPESWLPQEMKPSPAKMMATHATLSDMDENDVQKDLDESYTNRLY